MSGFPNASEAAGFPRRKTRRGGRGRKAVGSAGVPVDHMKNLTNAMSLGDHGKAKQHAFALIRSLPKAQLGVPLPNDLPDASGPTDATASGGDAIDGPNVTSVKAMPKNNAPAKPAGNPMRLAAMLKGLKK